VEELEVPGCGSFKIKFNGEGVPEKLKTMFESEIWDEIARKCVNCGACTYLCPTCHCFDINQEVRGEDGVKYRCWDSCMFGDYTQMAGGHNPRPGKKERVRNRFMHKLCFFPERYNMLLCTGCGRCLENCPVQMDITSVIKRVQEVG
jgi:ferredoxin